MEEVCREFFNRPESSCNSTRYEIHVTKTVKHAFAYYYYCPDCHYASDIKYTDKIGSLRAKMGYYDDLPP